uniref:HIG1 domain-containing protein n=1 Tax=Romanomermis culicivorax TaxID=13658 RepID=A0A915HX19_ROMCU
MADSSSDDGRPRSIKRVFLENPFVPLGTLAVILSVGLGLKNMTTGNQTGSQAMMRNRVGAQLFLVGGLVASAVYISVKQHLNKEKDDN